MHHFAAITEPRPFVRLLVDIIRLEWVHDAVGSALAAGFIMISQVSNVLITLGMVAFQPDQLYLPEQLFALLAAFASRRL